MRDDRYQWFSEMVSECSSADEWLTPTWRVAFDAFEPFFSIRPDDQVLDLLGLMIDEIDRLRAMVADAILYGMVIESCDRCGCEILSIPRDEHPEGILWCAGCAKAESGGES